MIEFTGEELVGLISIVREYKIQEKDFTKYDYTRVPPDFSSDPTEFIAMDEYRTALETKENILLKLNTMKLILEQEDE